MQATLGVVGAETAFLVLLQRRQHLSDPGGLRFIATSHLAELVPALAADVAVVGSIADLTASSDVILVGTEPADTVAALKSLAPFVGEDHIVIASSVDSTLNELRVALGPSPGLLRTVLHPDRLVEDILLVCAESSAATERVKRATEVLGRVAVVEQVPEDSLVTAHAAMLASKECLATALAGMEDGAVEGGLPRDMARSFVLQTAVATALLLQDNSGSPADLKDQVASPGGTTIAGLAVLEDLGVRGAFIRAVEAAVRRAREERDEERSRMVE